MEEKKDKLDEKMDGILKKEVSELHAHDDETGDGKINFADLKLQLDRVEAQLSLQDMQNRIILRRQKILLTLTTVLVVVLSITVGYLSYKTNIAYEQVQTATTRINEVAQQVTSQLDALDPEAIQQIVSTLPNVMDQLNKLDIEAMNNVMARLPSLLDTVSTLQSQVESLLKIFGGGSIGGNILSALLNGAS